MLDVVHACVKDGILDAGDEAVHEETGPPLLSSSHTGLEGQPQTEGGSGDESDSVCPSEDAFDNLTGEDAAEGRYWGN